MSRRRCRAAPLAGVVVLAATTLTPSFLGPALADPALPATGITLVGGPLVVTRSPHQTLVRPDLGVTVVAHDRSVELRTRRSSYRSRFVSRLTVHGHRGRRLHSGTLAPGSVGQSGILAFADATITGPTGVVARGQLGWCPGQRGHRPVTAGAEPTPRYPGTCTLHHFAFGLVNGLERGWASALTNRSLDLSIAIPDGRYEVTVTVRAPVARRLGMPARARTVRFPVDLVTTPAPVAVARPLADAHAHRSAAATRVAHPLAAPVAEAPPSDALPDLRPLPAWSFTTMHLAGRDHLRFAANTWNAGPAPLVVEGYRIPGTDVMDAYQVFVRDGVPVATRLIGQMEYHRAAGHDHWHFLDFTGYDLTDTRRRVVASSGKQSWCIAPTTAVDLTVPGAQWRPESTDLQSACGDEDAQWIRQALPAGWGDTYVQAVAGQTIDITDVPNGRYFLRVTVNPDGRLVEQATAGNASYRLVVLGGVPGSRTVSVPAHQGIDTR